MASRMRAEWAAQEYQADQIRNALQQIANSSTPGICWTVFDDSATPDEWHCWQIRRSSDGLTISLDWPEPYGAAKHKPARIEIRGVWPIGVEGQKENGRTPYGQAAPATAISLG